ncbi:MAG: formate/nitrite transporter family protein [Lachnospiraceae bacterium]
MKLPSEILEGCIAAGEAKVKKTLEEKLILGFIGGAMISLGFLAYFKVVATVPESLGGLGSFIGACVFPIGLIVILLAGGELVTGNMMVVSLSMMDKKVTFGDWIKNLLTITVANTVGAIFVAYVFGHLVGLTAGDVFGAKIGVLAEGKLTASVLQCFLSGMGCNWFVGLAVWLCNGAKEGSAKIIATWFPIMIFVLIGFQHSVANIFLLAAAIFEGHGTWGGALMNLIPVYLGNLAGAMLFVSLFYYRAYRRR